MDQEGLIQFVNRQTETLFGYDRDQLVGQRIEMLVPRSLWPICAEHQRDYLAGRRTCSSGLDIRLCGRRQDGTDFPINVSLSHVDTTEALLVITLLVITAAADVTAQQQWVDNAQLAAGSLQYCQQAIVARTLAGIITSWNQGAEAMFGYSSQEIVGEHINLLVPRDRAREMISILSKISAGRPVPCFETKRVRKDGTMVPVSLCMAPICHNGAVIGTCVTYHDVTTQQG
jgi:PAS domain S-box-containing protein